MKRHYAMLAAALAVVAMAGAAQALIVEGTIYSVDDGNGVLNDNAEDTSTIDYIQFEVTATGTVAFDVLAYEGDHNVWGVFEDLNSDGDITLLDPYIYLYSMDGTFLAANDDGNGFEDGSISSLDSYLSYDFGAAGSYVLAIGEFHLGSDEVLSGVNDSLPRYYDPDLGSGILGDADYRLTITGNVAAEYSVSTGPPFGQNEVPEPASLTLLGLGLAGWAIRRQYKTA